LAPERGDVDPALSANVDRVHARQLPPDGVDPGCIGLDLLAIADETAEQSQGHGAAADVAGTDKKDVFHHDARREGGGLRQSKIKRSQVNEPRPRTPFKMISRRFSLTIS
jgi:hypothetical protein